MDINLARTFLMVAETGSFIDAARRLNITQSTVSARIKVLESELGRALFERSKMGAALTDAGEQFRRHALALVRVWQHAQMEIGLTERHRDHLAMAAPPGLWDGFLLRWLSWMRKTMPDIAVSAASGQTTVLTQRLIEGTLDLAVMYRPVPPPGLALEHLFDEEMVLVRGARIAPKRASADYISIGWGPEFEFDHTTAFPELRNPGLRLDIGSAGLDYMISHELSGYAPLRLLRPHLSRGRVKIARRARRFIYPVYMVYPEDRDQEAFQPILESLRRDARRVHELSADQTA